MTPLGSSVELLSGTLLVIYTRLLGKLQIGIICRGYRRSNVERAEHGTTL
jgi:hypothetical protein